MAPPSSPAFQQFHHLDTSSPDFDRQLHNVLYGKEYEQCIPNLKEDDLVWLANYLDEVRRRIVFQVHSAFKPA